jgi:flagellar biosynthesis GTPase FlhF
MKVKTYRGNAIGPLLNQIKAELGEDPVIISTKQCQDNLVEISVELGTQPKQEVRPPIRLTRIVDLNLGIDTPPAAGADLRSILDNHGLASGLVASIMAEAGASGALVSQTDRVIANGLSRVLSFESRLPLKKKFVALIGATGVGKTTTIAKLAARVKAAFDIRIGLISADTYRVGAGFHLQSYASLMQLPFRSLDPRLDFKPALTKAMNDLRDCDLVLIDTAGCSPRQHARVSEMSRDFEGFPGIEKLLVLPAPSNSVDLKVTAENFNQLDFDRVIITKLDESGFIGPVINTVQQIGKPLAFLTTGQRVPEDIEPASARRLGWMLTQTIH